MFFRSLFDSRKLSDSRTGARRTRPQRKSFRLQLEALEDRCLLSFSPAVVYPIDHSTAAIVSADFNGDGQPDLATAGGDQVSVLLGNPDGSFQAAQSYPTGPNPGSLAVGDFNNDGRLDLVTADWGRYDGFFWLDGSMSVLLGNGHGSFQPPQRFSTGGSPIAMTIGDFNSDGRLDAAYVEERIWGQYSDYYFSVALGDGYGGFSNGVSQGPVTHWAGSGADLTAGDLNGDGRLDVVWTIDGGSLVLLGNGDGTFADLAWVGGATPGWSAVLADLDGDGRLDLATAGWGGYDGWSEPAPPSLAVWLGNGDGTFRYHWNVTTDVAIGALATADFDGDGRADLVGVSWDGVVGVFRGRGDGTFQSPGWASAGYYTTSLAVGDFNRDGRPDAAAGLNAYYVSVLLNDGAWPPPDAPSLRIGDVTVTEGNSGTTAATFTVTLSAAYDQPVTVAYATADGDATAGSDYQAVSGTLTFAPGETKKTISAPVIGDRLGEETEIFIVNIGGATNANIMDGFAVGTIVDDEPRVRISDVSKSEGRKNQKTLFTFTVSLSAAYDQAVTVSFRTADGTATAGSGDYVAKTGAITFAPGETTKTITIEVKGDRSKEADEIFYLDLFDLSSNALFTWNNRGVGTIWNDD